MTKGKPEGQELTCIQCGAGFTFTAGEQAFFYDKKLQPPKRCPACRQARKQDPIKSMKRIPS